MRACWHITGASRGLGKALAEYVLGQEDTLVYGYARHQSVFHERYVHRDTDLSDLATLESFQFDKDITCEQIVLVNNAGTLGQIAFTGNIDFDQMTSAYHTNILAVHALSNAFIRAYHQVEAKKVIINITSGAAQNAYAGWSIYCATKAAMDMLTKCLRAEMAGVANPFYTYAIAPGIMDTEMQAVIRQADETQFPRKEKFIELHATGKLIPVEQVAQAYFQFVEHCNGTEEPIQKIAL